ncbi:Uncharacterised protein [Vibrio cholerae]|nr:Uncharacterised protein [Vibrio cholerae]
MITTIEYRHPLCAGFHNNSNIALKDLCETLTYRFTFHKNFRMGFNDKFHTVIRNLS